MVQRKKQVLVNIRTGKARSQRKRATTKQAENGVTEVGKLIRSFGSLGGGALGTYFGHPALGTAAGNSLAAAVSKWLGFGDYVVKSNTIVSKASTGIPMMHKDGQTVVIRHREFIGTVTSTTDFTVQQSYQLNPGDEQTFPWLSTIANSFQEYRFRGVVFHYIPTSGTAISGTSPSLGSVMMQTSYRANDTPPASKSELLNEYWSGESVPSETFAHPIECNPDENPFNVQYVRRGALPTGENQLFYDLGVTHLCTQGQLAAGNVLGDLWVTYEVELKKPIVASNVTSSSDFWTGITTTGTITTPFTDVTMSTGSLNVEGGTTGFYLHRPPPGRYLVTIILTGTGMSGSWGSLSLTNGALVPWDNGSSNRQVTTATLGIFNFAVLVPGASTTTFNWAGLLLAGTLTHTGLTISRIS